MKITYPKPIRKAAHIRRAELVERLQLAFVVIAALATFAVVMQSLPYLIRLYDGEGDLSSFTSEKLRTYEQEKNVHLMRELHGEGD